MATHTSILDLRIPGTEEPGGLQSMGSQTVRLDWMTFTLLTVCLLSFFGHGNKPDQEGLCSQRAYILVGQRSDNKINVK